MGKNRAFTLAKVLITLSIIGVVAAITILIIIENYRLKQLETGLKNGYSVIAQALDMYFAKTGERLTSKNTDRGELKSILIQYLSIIKDGDLDDCTGYENYTNEESGTCRNVSTIY